MLPYKDGERNMAKNLRGRGERDIIIGNYLRYLYIFITVEIET
jgi:hypothetical protein